MNALWIITAAFAGLASKYLIDWVLARRRTIPFKDVVARWWRSGLNEPPTTLEFHTRQGVKSGRPLRCAGLHLLIDVDGPGRETVMITAGEAVDREAFWKAWRYFGGKAIKLVDEDGDEVVLE